MKITTKIRTDVINKLTKKFDTACLRRDAFLERVLEIEIPALDKEVAIANSDEARKVVSKSLAEFAKDRDRMKPVSFSLRNDLVAQLDDICERKRIVRDAFFNRVLFLLAASPKVIDCLMFSDSKNWRTEVWSELKHDGPFFNNVFYPLEPEIDPFWPIRNGLELLNGQSNLTDYEDPSSEQIIQVEMDVNNRPLLPDSLYTITFTENELLGLNCYLPEWKIPGHPEQDKYQKDLDEYLDELLGLGGSMK